MRRSNLRSGTALLMCAGLLGSGCFYPADRGRLLETRVEQLTHDNERLSAELATAQQQLAATLPKIDEKVTEVTQALESLDKASRQSGADIGVRLSKNVEDLAMLRGQVETYLHRIGELEAALQKTQGDVDAKVSAMGGTDAAKAAEAKKKSQELQRPTDKKEFLKLAQDQAKGGEVALARQLFQEFTKKWPRDELVSEAHFGLGESYFAEDRCPEALYEYGKIIQEFAKSKVAPPAYLRSSDCFAKLKMKKESRQALSAVIEEYPKSDAAKTAKARLAAIEKEEKKGKK